MTTGTLRAAAGRRSWPIACGLALAAALALDAWQTASPDVSDPAPDVTAPAAPLAAPGAASPPLPITQADAAARACSGLGRSPARATPSPAGWVVSDDYPADAIRRGSQGASAIRFTVTPGGRVASCTVTQSSGDPLLDGTACRLVTARGRYTPERDEMGCPTTSAAKTLRFTWRLPEG